MGINSNTTFLAAGGYTNAPLPNNIEAYGYRRLGPQNDRDAVIYSGRIDPAVQPTGDRKNLPYGRIYTMTDEGTFQPGVPAAGIPMAVISIGSYSDATDVTGGLGGDPAVNRYAYVPINDAANQPFQSLIAGYVYETSEFVGEEVSFKPGVALKTTAMTEGADDFAVCGTLSVGTVWTDTIVGIVVRGVEGSSREWATKTIAFQGYVLPKAA